MLGTLRLVSRTGKGFMGSHQVCALVVAILLGAGQVAYTEPMFPNSVVSNDLDFIRENDPGVHFCLRFEGRSRAEMPDKRTDVLFVDNVLLFSALFADGDDLAVWVHPDVGDKGDAEEYARPVALAVGRLPSQMRLSLERVVIHNGDETAFAEDLGRFFVLYSKNIRSRISTRDLSETVFHEAVHATLDEPHASSAEWMAAQQADGAFITEYGGLDPKGEDMAESALFAWTLLKHPGRLPPEIEAKAASLIPSRIAFFEDLFKDWEPPQSNGKAPAC